MARYTRRRAYRRRRSAVRRVRRTRRRMVRRGRVAPRPINLGYLLPDRVRMKMPYYLSPTACGTTTYYYEYVLTGNAIYDVDPAAAGQQQPMLFDQMMVLYGAYYVAASKIKVNLHPVGTASVVTTSGSMYIVPFTSASAQAGTIGVAGFAESRFARTTQYANNYNRDTQLRHYMTSRRMLSAPGRTSYDAGGSVAANPTEIWYWHLLFTSADLSTSIAGNLFSAKVVYYVEFSIRNPTTIS